MFLSLANAIRNIEELDKDSFIKSIRESSSAALWDYLLSVQVELITPRDLVFLKEQVWWEKASNILEVGCGNGEHLAFLSKHFPDKAFTGLDIDPHFVHLASSKYSSESLTFSVQDIMEEKCSLENTFDVVILRLVLQHLDDPFQALKHVSKYLKPGAYVYIAEAADSLSAISCDSSYMDELKKRIRLQHLAKEKSGRRISLSILNSLDTAAGELSQTYSLEYSNLQGNSSGEFSGRPLIFYSAEEKFQYFKMSLVFFGLAGDMYGLSIDLDRLYDDMFTFLETDAWTSLGWHRLVLQSLR